MLTVRPAIWVVLLLVLGTLLAYGDLSDNGFVPLDDDAYIYENPHVRVGLTGHSLRWAFTATHANNWHPLTWLSHMLDCQLFGLDPGRHHLIGLLLHLLNALLIYGILYAATAANWRSALVAALFALHPMHVESVAWAAERKDLLSTLCGLLVIAAYLRYAKRPTIGRYLPLLLLFALGLLAKAMLVTLPFALFLIDYWPLGRMRCGEGREEMAKDGLGGEPPPGSSRARLILEKLPLLGMALASSIITFLVQRGSGAVAEYPLLLRLANALNSYLAYMGKLLWPRQLAIPYPYKLAGFPLWSTVLAFCLLLGVTLYLFAERRRLKPLLVGWLWFLGTLVPVIGAVQVGAQAMADRYSYLPSIGFFIVIVWGIAGLVRQRRRIRQAATLLACVVFVFLIIATRGQVRHWRDGASLFTRALAVTEDNVLAGTFYGNVLYKSGRYEEAIGQYRAALALQADFADAHFGLGCTRHRQNRLPEAVDEYRESLRLKPGWTDPLNNLAWIYATAADPALRNVAEALRLSELALELSRDDLERPNLLDTRAAALAAAGRFAEAVAGAEAAIRAAETLGDDALAADIRHKLDLYRAERVIEP